MIGFFTILKSRMSVGA